MASQTTGSKSRDAITIELGTLAPRAGRVHAQVSGPASASGNRSAGPAATSSHIVGPAASASAAGRAFGPPGSAGNRSAGSGPAAASPRATGPAGSAGNRSSGSGPAAASPRATGPAGSNGNRSAGPAAAATSAPGAGQASGASASAPVTAEASGPAAVANIQIPWCWLWAVVPVLLFLGYFLITRMAVNGGHLVVQGAIQKKNITLAVSLTDKTIGLGGVLDFRSRLHKVGHIHPIPDDVTFNLTLPFSDNHTFSGFPFVTNFTIGPEANTTRVVLGTRVFHVSEELILLINERDKENMLWVELHIRYRWHVKEQKLEIGKGEYRYADYTCHFALRGSPNDRGNCG